MDMIPALVMVSLWITLTLHYVMLSSISPTSAGFISSVVMISGCFSIQLGIS